MANMDSPIHPDLRPGHKPPNPLPFPIRNDPLIHGNDIELAPTKRPFQEHLANPAPEVIEHSTLEVTKSPHQPQAQPHPHLFPVTPDQPHPKTWESHTKADSIYSHAAPTQVSTNLSSAGRYSYSDFSTPFDRRPLVAPPPKGPRVKREKICGLKRHWFWIVLVVGLFLIVVAVATGVGVGVGLGGQTGSPSTTTPTSTRTIPTPVATLPPSIMACPDNNLTLYQSTSHPQKKYILLCGRDYNSNLGATQDLYNTQTDTLAECLDLCASEDVCVGAGWGFGAVDGKGKAICWLKSKLGVFNVAQAWSFIIRDDVT